MKILSLLRMTVLAASCLGAHSASAVFVRDIGVSQFQDRSHQDRFQIVHSPEKTARFSYFGMFDGHGVQGSAVAAEYAANHLHEKIFSKFKVGVNFTRLLELAFIETDTDICHLTLFGTTATVALLDNLTSTLYIANVGDSPAILYDGAIKELSRNHFPVKDEKKRIKKLGGVIYGGRVGGKLAITRSLGDLDLKWKGDAHLPGPSGRSEIESIDLTRYMVSPLPYVAIRTLKSKPMQFLIIAADGIIGTSALQAKEAVKIVKKELGAGRSAKQAADALLEYARIVPKNRDDKSVIIIVFGDTQLSQSHLARHYELRENVSAGDVNYFNYDDYLKNPTLR